MTDSPASASRKFAPASRLHRPQEFEQVLRQRREGGPQGRRRQARGRWFAIAAHPNGLTHCRLGIIAARKVVPLAVARNRHKRLIREVFRSMHASLPAMDLVVRVMEEAKDTVARRTAREELAQLMLAVVK